MRLDLDAQLRELLGEIILRYKVVRLHFFEPNSIHRGD